MEEMNNNQENTKNETVENTGLDLGERASLKNVYDTKEPRVTTNDIDTALSENSKKVYESLDADIGVPTSNYQEFTDIFVKNASQEQQGKKTIADHISELGETYKTFFERYVANYGSIYPSEDLTELLNEIKEGDLINSLKHGDKEVFQTPLELKDKINNKDNNSNVSNALILSKFLNNLDGGNTVSVPLWHSGFRVTLTPPTVSELNTLHLNVVRNEIDLGRETMSLSTAANRSYSIDIIKDLINKKIYKTTLDVDHTTTDIFQYISILDFDFLLLGLLGATYVNKIPIVRSCSNVIRHSTASEIGCTHSVSAMLDANKLVFVDKKLLTSNMINTISKRVPGSVSLSERENYLNDLDKQLDNFRKRESTFKRNSSVIKFKIPDVNSYIQDSSLWVEEAMAEVNNLADNYSLRKKQELAERIKDVRGGTIMISNVGSVGILTDTGDIFSTQDKSSIYQAIKSITNSIDILNDFFESINKFVNRSYLAIPATPNYICPKCRRTQEGVITPKDFDSFIPLNVLDFFLTLVEVKIARTQFGTRAIL